MDLGWTCHIHVRTANGLALICRIDRIRCRLSAFDANAAFSSRLSYLPFVFIRVHECEPLQSLPTFSNHACTACAKVKSTLVTYSNILGRLLFFFLITKKLLAEGKVCNSRKKKGIACNLTVLQLRLYCAGTKQWWAKTI